MRKSICFIGIALGLSIFSMAGYAQDDDPDPVEVKLNFRNTTDQPVAFRFVDNSDEDESNVKYIPVHSEQPLSPGQQRTYQSLSGLSWEIVQNGKPYAQYTGDQRPYQIIDIKELASWQRPVSINFQNNTDEAVDLYWTGPDGKQTLILRNLKAGTQLEDEPVRCLPNGVWTITQNNNFYADYFPTKEPLQVVELKDLRTWYEPVELVFVNQTNKDLFIYFVRLDGREILYTKTESGRFDPLGSNQSMVQSAYPFQRWVVKQRRQRKRVVAEYLVTNEKRQTVRITNDLLQ